jgi:hypothetical protein
VPWLIGRPPRSGSVGMQRGICWEPTDPEGGDDAGWWDVLAPMANLSALVKRTVKMELQHGVKSRLSVSRLALPSPDNAGIHRFLAGPP